MVKLKDYLDHFYSMEKMHTKDVLNTAKMHETFYISEEEMTPNEY